MIMSKQTIYFFLAWFLGNNFHQPPLYAGNAMSRSFASANDFLSEIIYDGEDIEGYNRSVIKIVSVCFAIASYSIIFISKVQRINNAKTGVSLCEYEFASFRKAFPTLIHPSLVETGKNLVVMKNKSFLGDYTKKDLTWGNITTCYTNRTKKRKNKYTNFKYLRNNKKN